MRTDMFQTILEELTSSSADAIIRPSVEIRAEAS